MVSSQIAEEFQLWYEMPEDSVGQFVENDDDPSEGMPPVEPVVRIWRKGFQSSFVGDDMMAADQRNYLAGELLVFHPSGASSSYHLLHSSD